MRVSAHFTDAEFRCKCCGRVKIVPELVEVLERIRATTGRPLYVLSGYRCADHNAAVGGASRSLHLVGRAADLYRGAVTTGQAEAAGAIGIGTRGPWAVHVDVRSTGPARWRY